jgi:phosphoglycerate kinase
MFLEYADLKDKKIILRTDYNVPINNNIIQSTKRIDASLDTLNFILNQDPTQVIIISHLGRPKSRDVKYSLEPIRSYLETVLKKNIKLCELDDITSDKIIILENIRFYPEETKNLKSTKSFRKNLTKLGDVYINDAFGCCHREHSSIVGINTKEKYLGFLVQKELDYLSTSLCTQGVKTLILGGSKIIDKIQLIKNLIPKMDNILIGGGMAFTFLKHIGVNIGKSLFDQESFNLVQDIRDLADSHGTRIVLPIDFNCNNKFENDGELKYFDIKEGIEDNYMGLDIGYLSVLSFQTILSNSNLIIWNGPLGVFEFENFALGSKDIMKYMAELDAVTIIGGGDTTSCCEKFNLQNKMNHVSTGGGASLQLLEGNLLPGIKFITNC